MTTKINILRKRGIAVKSMKEVCLGMTEEDLDAWFMDKWDSMSKQVWEAGTYYQMCIDNGVVVDVYAILN